MSRVRAPILRQAVATVPWSALKELIWKDYSQSPKTMLELKPSEPRYRIMKIRFLLRLLEFERVQISV
ncbi:hypothetical protein DF286_09340 [Sphingosinicella humi]|uniref:Uncharacterized protein n=1 Tax=Allosphingosinicella humi TaxID=2068657 RepID=A0A2U2J3X1_9SPHN|nr:hypothetical protein DF286_09340 [Sphingosinicella humi]